ncbi:gamma-glutamylcyclotransferase family protein [Alicyclobacillus sendaiensis]|uniref:gamma-glutamylcyclotransferase family protein n=1 Tax=Alicyclobacillus sendaiensis TaxID=192387 RepID=UPI0026F455D0|nr:gamma-glutamylcyclotransferase family protein [Alicyclobacillus sendaiensis]
MPYTHIVFVYGTLRQGQPNRCVMEPHLVRELGKGQIRGAMYDWGFCPAVTLEEGSVVVGEWVKVTEEGLKALDRLEGYPHLYDRAMVEDMANGLRGWVYHVPAVKAKESGERVQGGDWVEYVLRSSSRVTRR